jgi:uncharacterized membrane protein YhaH (DUF805 family)
MDETVDKVRGFGARVRAVHDGLPGWMSFSGVASRRTMLLGLLPIVVIGAVLGQAGFPLWLSIPLGAPLVVAVLKLVIKRLRDAGIHWATAFLGFIPVIGWLVLAVLVSLPTKGLSQTSPRWKVFATGLAAFVAFSVVSGALVPMPTTPPTTTSPSTTAEQHATAPTEATDSPASGEAPPAGGSAPDVGTDSDLATDEVVAEDEELDSELNPETAPEAAPPVDSTAGATGGLEALVSRLRVEPEVQAGYDRDLFRHWIDADGDGCDARREVLIAESTTPVSVSSGCSLSGGTWYSAFEGVTTTDASSFDIDHFVPLKEAWDSGAHAWDSGTRQRFANDLEFAGSLIAVSASSNRSKGASDPAEWLPPNRSYRCVYLVTWVEVKLRWNLSADPGEIAAIRSAGSGC